MSTVTAPVVTLKESSWEVIEDGHGLGTVTRIGTSFMATSILRRPHLGVFVATKEAATDAIVTFAHTDESDGLVEAAALAILSADTSTSKPGMDAYRTMSRAALTSAGAL